MSPPHTQEAPELSVTWTHGCAEIDAGDEDRLAIFSPAPLTLCYDARDVTAFSHFLLPSDQRFNNHRQ